MSENLIKAALDYHRYPRSGKLQVVASKPLNDEQDLALAYSPGVAAACEAIVQDPTQGYNLTARSNLLAVITNGTAVLGLGNIGPNAAKPVMEGKAVLFKKFADIDAFDLEIAETDPKEFVATVSRLEPTFGGINLEDIKAPECFFIEEKLKETLKIPVFHDDQHGTAIVVVAAIINGLILVEKKIEDVVCVTSGAGAAACACLKLLLAFGMKKENIFMFDTAGLIYQGRTPEPGPHKAFFAQETSMRTLDEALVGADIFLGLSTKGVLTAKMVQTMASRPLILALANPIPEILPEEAIKARSDVIVATGRSDYPNQVNNVLCFPYVFRGALDVGATTINEEMKKAAVEALAQLARSTPPIPLPGNSPPPAFGPQYLIPKPFDPRLIVEVPVAVAQAAVSTGVATRPFETVESYRGDLRHRINASLLLQRPKDPCAHLKKIIFEDGENPEVLQAVQGLLADRLAYPILIGRRSFILPYLKPFGLGTHFDVLELEGAQKDPAYPGLYQQLISTQQITYERAKQEVLSQPHVLAALALIHHQAHALLCGPNLHDPKNFQNLEKLLGVPETIPAAFSALALKERIIFFVHGLLEKPLSPRDIVKNVIDSFSYLHSFKMAPHIRLLCHDSSHHAVLGEVLKLLKHHLPQSTPLEDSGSGDDGSTSNLFVMPTPQAAQLALRATQSAIGGVSTEAIILGLKKPVSLIKSTATAQEILHTATLAITHGGYTPKDHHQGSNMKSIN